MQQSKFASIKRSTNNDNHDWESEEYSFKIFDTREEAVTWLLEQYEHWESNAGVDRDYQGWGPDLPDWKVLYNFFMTSANDDVIFHWEWKRRGNFRTYKIVEFTDVLKTYAKAKNRFKLRNGHIKTRE
jgi:hypothetical protein